MQEQEQEKQLLDGQFHAGQEVPLFAFSLFILPPTVLFTKSGVMRPPGVKLLARGVRQARL